MTQTNLDAYALANGFGKTTQQMTQSEQVMLRYQYVMNQTRLPPGISSRRRTAGQTKPASSPSNGSNSSASSAKAGSGAYPSPEISESDDGRADPVGADVYCDHRGAFGKQQAQANTSAAAVENVADAPMPPPTGKTPSPEPQKRQAKRRRARWHPLTSLMCWNAAQQILGLHRAPGRRPA